MSQSPDQNILHMQLSPAFTRLEEIFSARAQPWSDQRSYGRPKQDLKPYVPGDIDTSIAGLNENELARAMIRACMHGELQIAQQIWENRGPFAISHERTQYHEIINGTALRQGMNTNHLFSNASTRTELSELLEWMPKVGLGSMVGVGSEHSMLLQSSELEYPITKLAFQSHYEGAIPTLSHGQVHNPELMLALKDKASQSAYSNAYDQILCWIPNEDVASFKAHLSVFKREFEVGLQRKVDGKDEYRTVSPRECDADLMSQVNSRDIVDGAAVIVPRTWAFEYLRMRTEPNDNEGLHSRMVLGYMGSEALQHGFGYVPGHQLCLTTVSFLSQFEISNVNATELAHASEFAEAYFPLDLITYQRERDQGKQFYATALRLKFGFGMGMGEGMGNFRAFCKAFGDNSPIRDQMRREVPRPFVERLLNLTGKHTVDFDQLLALREAFGMDNKQMGISLDRKQLQHLHDIGFVFAEGTTTRLKQRKSASGRQLTYERENTDDSDVFMDLYNEPLILREGRDAENEVTTRIYNDAYRNALRMGLWPSETPKPESIKDALSQACKKKRWGQTNHEMALQAFFDVEGVESCVKAAVSTSHWNFLRRHFGHNEVEPYLNLASRKTRGSLIQDDLGI